MCEKNIRDPRWKERGNVLFLILIAVALFAALSYAVTSSSRSGGGDASDETNLITSAQLTQYPAAIRTSIVRMIVSKGADVEKLEFNSPDEFDNLSGSDENGVFHPSGGGATYSKAPEDVMDSSGGNTGGAWAFNAENEIYYVGKSGDTAGTPTTDTVDVIAFLPGIKKSICTKINTELGITGIPSESGIDYTSNMVNPDGADDNSLGFCDGGCAGTIGQDVTELNGQPFGCFDQGGKYVYYHVLVER